MQHNGTTIYLEKLLNEYFQVPGYDTQHHDTTKRVYIGDIQETGALYIYQDQEPDVSFLQDEDSESDLFLDVDVEGSGAYSFTIFIPVGYAFQEPNLRAEIDSYRYFGKKYNIQTY
ncbi:hypothetical protein FNO01nite_30590 [Flavobacterium noncentrifugens]|nr:hypothetical protein FNO01nite_30590 [Flavobacterium noncentrifugens]